jgi:ribonucleoside-diphosphate reductase alpha chain
MCSKQHSTSGAIKSLDELEEMAEYAVRILDFVIDMQDYPVPAAKKMLKRRSIGVGVTNFAYWLAKNNLTYTDDKSLVEIDRLF